MTVKLYGDEIALEGICRVQEAEELLAAIAANPGATVVLRAQKIHTALWQVLIAAHVRVAGAAPDDFSAKFIVPLLAGASGSPAN